MSDFEYLSLDDVIELARRLAIGPVRDLGLLDSALYRPRSTAFGEDLYPSIELKAAALLHSLVNNHALVDGNKRLSFVTVNVFCDLNGFEIALSDDDAFNLIVEIAASDIDVDSIAKRLNVIPKKHR